MADEAPTLDLEVPVSDGMNIGKVISEKLSETVQNVDVISMLQKLVAMKPEEEESEIVREKLQGVLAKYNEMNEDDKMSFVQQLKDALAAKLALKLNEKSFDTSAIDNALNEAIWSQIYMLAAGVFVLILIFVFFGYKLYKSIKDKEKKKEEKKMAKLQKKKK